MQDGLHLGRADCCRKRKESTQQSSPSHHIMASHCYRIVRPINAEQGKAHLDKTTAAAFSVKQEREARSYDIHMNENHKSCCIKVCSGDVVRWKRCIFSKVGKMYAFDEKFGLPSVPLNRGPKEATFSRWFQGKDVVTQHPKLFDKRRQIGAKPGIMHRTR